MTKEITKAIIMQEIEDKFKLRDFDPSKFLFDETIVPVYEVRPHTSYRTADYREVSVSSGPGSVTMKSVPKTERWILYGYNIIFMAVGAYTVTGLYVKRYREQQADSFIYLDMTLGQSASYRVLLPTPCVLEPGDVMYIYIDSYTSTANIRLYYDYEVEEIR